MCENSTQQATVTNFYVSPQEECYDDYFLGEECGSFTIGEPSVVAFLLFTAIWSILVLITLGLVSIWVKAVNHPIAGTVLDGVTWIFWFSAAVATAVPFANSFDPIGDAAIALSFVAFALFVATFVLNILRITRGEGSVGNKETNAQNPELQHI